MVDILFMVVETLMHSQLKGCLDLCHLAGFDEGLNLILVLT